jgi:hypothetical protein
MMIRRLRIADTQPTRAGGWTEGGIFRLAATVKIKRVE